MSTKTPQELLTQAQEKWAVLASMWDDFDRDGREANIYDILGDLEQALSIQPHFPAAWALKAELVGQQLGAWTEALEFADQAVAQDPGNEEYERLRECIRHRDRSG